MILTFALIVGNLTIPVYAKETVAKEAEDAYLEGAIIDNKHLGFNGAGFVDYSPNQPGGK